MAAKRGGKDDLYVQIGRFLADHCLSPEPAHYSFAFNVLTDPRGVIAQAVARLTDGGVRLSRRDIEKLGGSVIVREGNADGNGGHGGGMAGGLGSLPPLDTDGTLQLVTETQAQVDGFASMMREMHDETRGFGRDLAQSAAAIGRSAPGHGAAAGLDEIARITGSMLSRIHDAELRLAHAAAEADALRAKLAEANDSARRDPLTGLPNRRAFEESFITRTEGDGPYCLAVCDIDRFKRINDEHGHPVGDRVLSAVAHTLEETCPGQLVVRHGGEEFAILLRGIDLYKAADHLDHVRASVAAKRFRVRESDRALGQVTLSIGVTAVQQGEESVAAFDRADRLLYTAKADGRDRVCAG